VNEGETMSSVMVNRAIERLRKQYAASLPVKVSKAAAAVVAALGDPWDPALGETAHRLVHSLIGSSGTYGFAEISRVARSAEEILRASMESRTLPSPEEALRLREIVAHLEFVAVIAAAEAGASAA
jgi:HPt (histidine-containing phosphotransfer) domain-containing protein